MLHSKHLVFSLLVLIGSSNTVSAQPKHVIAVLPFENKVSGFGSAGAMLGDGMTEMLTTELLKSDRFVVIERELLRDIVREQEVGMSGLVTEETAVQTGGLAGAQFFIKGAVTEFNPNAGGGGISIGWDLSRIATRARRAYLAIDVRIVDNSTGKIYSSHSASATAKSRGSSASTGLSVGGDMSFGISGFEDTAVGQAVRSAIREVVGYIEDEANLIPWQGTIIKADKRQAYINRGKNTNIARSDELFVYSKGMPLIDPDTGFNLGSEEEYLCSLTVSKVNPNFSIAKLGIECKGLTIKRGDIVRFD